MVHHTKCPTCGARNSIPPTGLTMACEYCGFSRPVPDADKRRKKIERAEAQRLKQEQNRLKAQQRMQGRLAGQQAVKQAKRASSLGCVITVVILVAVLGPLIGVLSNTTSIVRQVKRVVGIGGTSSPTGADPGDVVQIDKSAQRSFARGAKALRDEGYAQQSDARGGDTADPLTLELKQGRCYALLVASRSQIELVRLVVPGDPLVARPTRFVKRWVVARYCPTESEKVRAMVTLQRTGTYAWGLFDRPFNAAGATAPEPDRPGGAANEEAPDRGRRHAPKPTRPGKKKWTPHQEF